MGNLNAKIWEERMDDIVGPFELGTSNERGGLWAQYWGSNDLIIANAWLRKLARLLWIWESLGV